MPRPIFASTAFLDHCRKVCTAALGAVACFGALPAARAQLNWGVDGAGGSGNWDTTTANWYDGTNNVVWNGTTAVFGGTAGTVDAAPFLPVQGMTFNVAGYTISNGFFISSGNLNVTVNADATIDSICDSSAASGTFIKNGAGTLTYTGSNFFGNVQLNAGNYVATTTSGSFFSNFTLANAPGVALTLGGSVASGFVQGLNGGGTAGGVVQPGAQGGLVNVVNSGGGSFAGVLQDSASTQLGYTQFGGTTAQILTGTNTYSGPTTLTAGALTFAGAGSAASTSQVSLSPGTTLTFDNSATAMGNRITTAAPVLLNGGTISLVGNASTAVTQALGSLQFYGAGTLNATLPGTAAATLSFTGITRNGAATLNVTGNGGVTWGGIANGVNGIIAPYVTAGNEWAVAGTGGTVQPLASYATDPATAGATDNVKITAAGTTLPGTATWSTLNLQNAAAATQTLGIGQGQTLTLAGGGLLTSGSGPAEITGGTLAAGGELVVTNRNALNIGSTLAETSAGTDLTKSGEGTLTLTGNNTYSGTTHVVQGVLAVSGDANLGRGAAISFEGGTLQANGSFATTKNLTSPTGQTGQINTNGYNVTVSGTNASVQQFGAGTLTLTNPATGTTVTSPTGLLALPNATSGTSTIMGGTLLAAGTLTQLNLNGSGTLDVGGPGAQSLTLGPYNAFNDSEVLTVRFTLGSLAQDQLTIDAGSPPIFSNQTVLYTIDQLGALQTGVSYIVLNLPNGSAGYTASEFGLSPESMADGYQGTFTVNGDSVTLILSAVPEPSTWALLGGAAALTVAAVRKRARGQA